MSSVPAEFAERKALRLSFHFWVVFVMCACVFGGFALAAIQRWVMHDPKTMPPVVHLHGVTFIAPLAHSAAFDPLTRFLSSLMYYR